MRIRWDAGACAGLLPASAEAMRDAIAEGSGHSSSIHAEGRAARRRLDAAREAVASYWGAAVESVVLVAGGSEANAAALHGTLHGVENARVVVFADAHPSVLAPLAARGAAAAEIVTPARDGTVPPERIAAAARGADPPGGARLVSLPWVCHESGRVLPIEAIARALGRDARSTSRVPPLIHLDACAEGGRLGPAAARSVAPFADLATIAAEKFGGPLGIGAVILLRPERLEGFAALVPGTAQFGRRGGGVSPVLAAGFAAAVRARGAAEGETARTALALRTRSLCARLVEALGSESDETWRDLTAAEAAPGILLLVFPGLSGEEIAARSDLDGVSVSSGAACASGAGKGSEVLRARGWDESFTRGALRISLDMATDDDDAEAARRCEAQDARGVEILAEIVRSFRARGAGASDASVHDTSVSDTSVYGARVRELVATARTSRTVAHPIARVERENPVCGDRIVFEAGISNGRLEFSYRAVGCPPVLAAAEAAARRLDDAPPSALAELTRSALLADLAGLPPSSHHAVDLVAEAVAALAAARPS